MPLAPACRGFAFVIESVLFSQGRKHMQSHCKHFPAVSGLCKRSGPVREVKMCPPRPAPVSNVISSPVLWSFNIFSNLVFCLHKTPDLGLAKRLGGSFAGGTNINRGSQALSEATRLIIRRTFLHQRNLAQKGVWVLSLFWTKYEAHF